MSNTWIFQADPRQFRIDDFIATSPDTCLWRVSTGGPKITINDNVYLWRAIGDGDRDRAAVAEAEIVGPVTAQRDDAASKPFWANRKDANEIIDRVILRIAAASQKIAYDDLKGDPVLANMKIMTVRAGTNFRLKNEHALRLASLWSKNGRYWNRKEIIAALLSYDRHDKPEQLACAVGERFPMPAKNSPHSKI